MKIDNKRRLLIKELNSIPIYLQGHFDKDGKRLKCTIGGYYQGIYILLIPSDSINPYRKIDGNCIKISYIQGFINSIYSAKSRDFMLFNNFYDEYKYFYWVNENYLNEIVSKAKANGSNEILLNIL